MNLKTKLQHQVDKLKTLRKSRKFPKEINEAIAEEIDDPTPIEVSFEFLEPESDEELVDHILEKAQT